MDRYFSKSPKQKSDDQFTKLGRVVVVVGKSGIGKTWTVRHELNPCIELTADVLRSKHETLDFLEKIRSSNLPVVLDEYEAIQDLVGVRELTGPPTNAVFVIISHVIPKFDFEFVVHQFPILTKEQIKVIAPDATDDILNRAHGDIRWVLQSLNFKSDFRDDFQGPRDFVTSLVAKGSNVNPAHFVGHPVAEPGNICSILNANYVDVPKNRIDLASVAGLFSTADVFETKVYAGDWDLLPFYNLFGCILPAIEIGHNLAPPLKPGSTWTKYQNMCMRGKKIQAMARRSPGKNLTIDELMLLRDYAEREQVGLLIEYGLTPHDMDVLNHLSPLRKIKPKALASLKKCLGASANPRVRSLSS
jgi:hypothetical protein